MVAIKAVVGGVLGAIVGTAVYYYINPNLTPTVPWAAIVPGVLAGLGVLLLCGSARTKGTGVIALVATLAALLIWPYVVAKIDAKDLVQPYLAKDTSESESESEAQVPAPASIESATAEPNVLGEVPDKSDASDDQQEATKKSEAADSASTEDKGSTENKVNDKSDYESNKDATSANPQSPKTSTVKKTVPQAPVTPAMRNEGIAFGISGLLAYLIGTGSGNRKQEVKTQSRNDQENDA